MNRLRANVRADSPMDWLEIESLISHPRIPGLVGSSSAVQTMAKAIERFSPHRGTVLILGESGTGKEVVAEALHRMGPSSAGPLVKFNCSNLLSGLAESQLFGHVRGAFTDARESYDGCFRQANGGTLLLDEVGELPLWMQSKILRAVENLEVQAVGSSETFTLDLRILVATNRDLRSMVAAGEFRADLYYRLDVATILTPPLRQRLEDTGALAAHFVAHYNRLFGKQVRYLSRHALTLIGAYEWPGNVRELAHTIERAILLCENDRIAVDDLTPELINEASARIATIGGGWRESRTPDPTEDPGVATTALDVAMRSAIAQSLDDACGDCAKAAQSLGISRPAIYRKMARYGLRASSGRDSHANHDGDANRSFAATVDRE